MNALCSADTRAPAKIPVRANVVWVGLDPVTIPVNGCTPKTFVFSASPRDVPVLTPTTRAYLLATLRLFDTL